MQLYTNFSLHNHNETHSSLNWMQSFWQNFLSFLCTGIVFVVSLLMQIRPASWTKEAMISGMSKTYLKTRSLGLYFRVRVWTCFRSSYWSYLRYSGFLLAKRGSNANAKVEVREGEIWRYKYKKLERFYFLWIILSFHAIRFGYFLEIIPNYISLRGR